MQVMPKRRWGVVWRFMLASVLVIGLAAGATAVAGLLQVKTIVSAVDLSKALQNVPVQLPAPGAPETLLLVGADHRVGQTGNVGNTDTMMLVRIDDSSSTINLLSVPRDLHVDIPGVGYSKLNAAYSYGGPRLLLKTLKSQVFPGLKVNHVLVVTFLGFSDLIDAIGCVYSDVDHRYYNNTAVTDYSSINIQPGYQKLCGDQASDRGALAFVRFRHTDSDIVRNARQQDFIRWAKDQYSTADLVNNEQKLIDIFGKHVETDHSLHTTDGLIDLAGLLINANGHQLKSIPFPVDSYATIGGGDYVLSDPTREAAAYREFMRPTHAAPPKSPSSKPAVKHRHHRVSLSTAGLTADSGDGRSQAAQLGHIRMPVYYPKLIVGGSEYCFAITANCDESPNPESVYDGSYPRNYAIRAGDRWYSAYVFTLVIDSGLGEYYTVQGTAWKNPPILNKPTGILHVGRRKLYEYSDGGRLAVVAIRTRYGVYWISNTLANAIGNSQMLAMAASLTPQKP